MKKIKKNDIIYDLYAGFPHLALGNEFEIPILKTDKDAADLPESDPERYEKVKIQVPAGTQPGKVFRLRGKGIPELQSYNKGDLLVQVKVWVPTKLNQKEKENLEELAKSENLMAPKKGKGFFQKFKEALNI